MQDRPSPDDGDDQVIQRLADKFGTSPDEDLTQDPEFRQLTVGEVRVLIDEISRRAADQREEA
jgi:hypothetical protein